MGFSFADLKILLRRNDSKKNTCSLEWKKHLSFWT